MSELHKDDDWLYFAGVDVARGGIYRSSVIPGTNITTTKSGDDFAIATMRIMHPDQEAKLRTVNALSDRVGKVQLVNIMRKTGVDAPQMSAIVHRMNRRFQYQYIMIDPRGGGTFVVDELRKPLQNTGAETFPVVPIITISDRQLSGVGNNSLVFFDRGEERLKESGFGFKGESTIVNKAHDMLKTAITKEDLLAPPIWAGWPSGGAVFGNADHMRKWLNNQHGLTEKDLASAEIDLAFLQLIQIERETDKEGNPALDALGMFSFTSKRKKDSAYAMLYCFFGICLWRQILALHGNMADVSGEFELDQQEV
jgi:hypothetical protein